MNLPGRRSRRLYRSEWGLRMLLGRPAKEH